MENAASIQSLFDCLDQSEKQLKPGQIDFIKSLKKQFARNKTLSHSQIAALEDINRYLPFHKEPV